MAEPRGLANNHFFGRVCDRLGSWQALSGDFIPSRLLRQFQTQRQLKTLGMATQHGRSFRMQWP